MPMRFILLDVFDSEILADDEKEVLANDKAEAKAEDLMIPLFQIYMINVQ
ncbi:14298_t:CDS:2, partial [Gigaspora rosea]